MVYMKKGKIQSATLLSQHLFPTQPAPTDNEAPIIMFYSPFKRTVETAEITHGVLNDTISRGKFAAPIRAMESRERFYRKFDMKSADLYDIFWIDDTTAPDHGENSKYDIELPNQLCDRATRFIVSKIENQMEGNTVTLAAHGDVCQILMTAFMRSEAWRHREILSILTQLSDASLLYPMMQNCSIHRHLFYTGEDWNQLDI